MREVYSAERKGAFLFESNSIRVPGCGQKRRHYRVFMEDIAKLIDGFKQFQERYFGEESSLFAASKREQKPKTLVIGCSDSRLPRAFLPGALRVIFLLFAMLRIWCLPASMTELTTG